jgi:hypothetical protein
LRSRCGCRCCNALQSVDNERPAHTNFRLGQRLLLVMLEVGSACAMRELFTENRILLLDALEH